MVIYGILSLTNGKFYLCVRYEKKIYQVSS